MDAVQFRVALNHDDPVIVYQGLELFSNEILLHHGVENGAEFTNFALIDGDIDTVLHPHAPVSNSGLLMSYLQSSPNIEELFGLWAIPSRNEDKRLCTMHMFCISSIIRCCRGVPSRQDWVAKLSNRILAEFSKSLINQIASENNDLIVASIVLLIEMARTSKQVAKDICQFFQLTNAAFFIIVQPSKKYAKDHDMPRIRSLLILLHLLLLESADDDVLISELLSQASIMHKFMNAVEFLDELSLKLLFRGVLCIQKHCFFVNYSRGGKQSLFDANALSKIVSLMSHDNEAISEEATHLILVFSTEISKIMSQSSKRYKVSSVNPALRQSAVSVIGNLQGHLDLQHRQIQMLFLNDHPSLLSKCISTIDVKSWEPSNDDSVGISFSLLAGLSHTCYLFENTSFDQQQIQWAMNSINSGIDSKIESCLKDIINDMIPTGLNKKELVKIITHKNHLLALNGLKFIFLFMNRLLQILQRCNLAASVWRRVEVHLLTLFQTRLPELHQIISIRSRIMKSIITDNSSISSDKNSSSSSSSSNDNFCGFGELLPSKSIETNYLTIILSIFDVYIDLLPSNSAASNYDFVKLMENILIDNSSSSSSSSSGDIYFMNLSVFKSTLTFLTKATTLGFCNWFGSKSDVMKVFSNVIVQAAWTTCVKPTPLVDLFSFAAKVQSTTGNSEVKGLSERLLRCVLMSSGLFAGLGFADFEMKIELETWISLISSSSSHSTAYSPAGHKAGSINSNSMSIGDCSPGDVSRRLGDFGNDAITCDVVPLLMDILFKLSYHWNFKLCSGLDTSVYFSPVMSCSLLLSMGLLNAFEAELPKHIRTRYSSLINPGEGQSSAVESMNVSSDANSSSSLTSADFFSKFNLGFKASLQPIFLHCLSRASFLSRVPVNYVTNSINTVYRSCRLSFDILQKEPSNLELLNELNLIIVHLQQSHFIDLSFNEYSDFNDGIFLSIDKGLSDKVDVASKSTSKRKSPPQVSSKYFDIFTPVGSQSTELSDIDSLLVCLNNVQNLASHTGDSAVVLEKSISSLRSHLFPIISNNLQSHNISSLKDDFALYFIVLMRSLLAFSDISGVPSDSNLASGGGNRRSSTTEICDEISSFIASLASNSSCPVQLALRINVLSALPNQTLFQSKHLLYVIFTVALNTYITIGKSNISPKVALFWSNFADAIVVHLKSPSASSSSSLGKVASSMQNIASVPKDVLLAANNIVFVLAFIIQKLIDHNELSQMFVSLTLHDRFGYELLNASVNATAGSSSSNSGEGIAGAHSNVNSKLFTKLDQVQTSAIISGTIPSLKNTTSEFIKSIAKKTSNGSNQVLSNILVRPILRLNFKKSDKLDARKYTFLGFYFNVHSLANTSSGFVTLPFQFNSIIPRHQASSTEPPPIDRYTLKLLEFSQSIQSESQEGLLRLFESIHGGNGGIGSGVSKSTMKADILAYFKAFSPRDLSSGVSTAVVDHIALMVEHPWFPLHMSSLHSACIVRQNISNGDGDNNIIVSLCTTLKILWDSFNNGNYDEYYRKCGENNKNKSNHFCEIWMNLYEETLDLIVNELVKPSSNPNLSDKKVLWRLLFRNLLLFEDFTGGQGSMVKKAVQLSKERSTSLRKKVNKMFKVALKNHLVNPMVLDLISSVVICWAKTTPLPATSAAKGKSNKKFVDQQRRFFLSEALDFADPDNFFNSQSYFHYLIGHTKFDEALQLSENCTNVVILRCVILLLNYIDNADTTDEDSSDIYAEEYLSLFQSLERVYKGTMSIADRLTLRVFSIMHQKGLCPSIDNISISTAPQLLSASGGSKLKLSESRTLFGGLSQMMVYSTVSSYPTQRGVGSTPFVFETTATISKFQQSYATDKTFIEKAWVANVSSKTGGGKKMDASNDDSEDNSEEDSNLPSEEESVSSSEMNNIDDVISDADGNANDNDNENIDHDDEEGMEEEEESLDGDGDEDDDEDDNNLSDSGDSSSNNEMNGAAGAGSEESDDFADGKSSDASIAADEVKINKLYDLGLDRGEDGSVLDPSFWILYIHGKLFREKINMRHFANSGALSLIIAGLCCDCKKTRVVVLSCLRRIDTLILGQSIEKDKTFLERPQLLILINFVKNMIDAKSSDMDEETGDVSVSADIVPSFPSVISLFLSRAALHILQPGHELFAKINKYLISRPFCDIKDVPLFELSIVDPSATPDDSDKLTCLRMIRDHLNSHSDHLNFCRKNGYLQLMMLFSIHYRDTKYAHAILDVIEKALGFKYSARYLIERCNIIAWITQTILSGKNQCGAFSSFSDSSHSSNGHSHKIRGEHSDVMPSVLVCRMIVLLRKLSGSMFLHLSEGNLTDTAASLEASVEALVKDLSDTVDRGSSSVPVNYFRQILLLLWDVSIYWRQLDRSKTVRSDPRAFHWLKSFCKGLKEGDKSNEGNDLIISSVFIWGLYFNKITNSLYESCSIDDDLHFLTKLSINTVIKKHKLSNYNNIKENSGGDLLALSNEQIIYSSKTSSTSPFPIGDNGGESRDGSVWSKSYCCAAHYVSCQTDVIAQSDCFAYYLHGDNDPSVNTSSSGMDIFQLFADAWLIHSRSKLDNVPLPSVNYPELSSLMASRAVLSFIGNMPKYAPNAVKSSLNSNAFPESRCIMESSDYLEIVRWALIESHIVVADLSSGASDASSTSKADGDGATLINQLSKRTIALVFGTSHTSLSKLDIVAIGLGHLSLLALSSTLLNDSLVKDFILSSQLGKKIYRRFLSLFASIASNFTSVVKVHEYLIEIDAINEADTDLLLFKGRAAVVDIIRCILFVPEMSVDFSNKDMSFNSLTRDSLLTLDSLSSLISLYDGGFGISDRWINASDKKESFNGILSILETHKSDRSKSSFVNSLSHREFFELNLKGAFDTSKFLKSSDVYTKKKSIGNTDDSEAGPAVEASTSMSAVQGIKQAASKTVLLHERQRYTYHQSLKKINSTIKSITNKGAPLGQISAPSTSSLDANLEENGDEIKQEADPRVGDDSDEKSSQELPISAADAGSGAGNKRKSSIPTKRTPPEKARKLSRNGGEK